MGAVNREATVPGACPATDTADTAAYCTTDDYAAMDDYTPSPWDELWHPRGCNWAYVSSTGTAAANRRHYDTLGPLHAVVGQNNCGG